MFMKGEDNEYDSYYDGDDYWTTMSMYLEYLDFSQASSFDYMGFRRHNIDHDIHIMFRYW